MTTTEALNLALPPLPKANLAESNRGEHFEYYDADDMRAFACAAIAADRALASAGEVAPEPMNMHRSSPCPDKTIAELAARVRQEAEHLFHNTPSAEDMAHLSMAIDALRRAAEARAVPAGEPVAWANFRHKPPSYVPYRTREEAQRSRDNSAISATQEGPYSVVPLYPPAPAEAVQAVGEQTHAARDVLAERHRQIETEGWTPEHDDEHGDGALAMAAGCYALKAGGSRMALGHFPWSHDAWKPGPTPRHCLVKAGALILAEIERLDRLPAPPTGDKA